MVEARRQLPFEFFMIRHISQGTESSDPARAHSNHCIYSSDSLSLGDLTSANRYSPPLTKNKSGHPGCRCQKSPSAQRTIFNAKAFGMADNATRVSSSASSSATHR